MLDFRGSMMKSVLTFRRLLFNVLFRTHLCLLIAQHTRSTSDVFVAVQEANSRSADENRKENQIKIFALNTFFSLVFYVLKSDKCLIVLLGFKMN